MRIPFRPEIGFWEISHIATDVTIYYLQSSGNISYCVCHIIGLQDVGDSFQKTVKLLLKQELTADV